MFNKIYHRNGIHGVPCGLLAPEASGWFRKEIHTLDILAGLKMRFAGFGAIVIRLIHEAG